MDNKQKVIEAIARNLMVRDGLNDDFYFDNRNSKVAEITGKLKDYLTDAERILSLPEVKEYFNEQK